MSTTPYQSHNEKLMEPRDARPRLLNSYNTGSASRALGDQMRCGVGQPKEMLPPAPRRG